MTRSAAHPGRLSEIARSNPLWLGAIASTPRTARASARAQLAAWGRPELADDVEEIVSELATNAVTASEAAGTAIGMRLVLGPGALTVEIYDQAPGEPVAYAPPADAECGRGLALVAAISDRWGWSPARGGGKVTWAVVTAP
jgi:anti-sigma regulatory factor (Ser/Thr protein kinase)